MTVSRAREAPPGEGERRDAQRRRQRRYIVAGLALVGFVPGLYVGFQHGAAAAENRPVLWSPEFAVLLAVVYLVAIACGSILLNKVMDEVERQNGYKAVSFAGVVLMLVYPVWFLLWKGGFVAEPIHWVLFVLFWLSLAFASLFYRFRQG